MSCEKQYNFETWLVDSGASFHMTPKRELFITYKPFKLKEAIKTADINSQLNIIGSGTVNLQILIGGNSQLIELRNVFHVENLSTNLLSFRELLLQFRAAVLPNKFDFDHMPL